MKNILFFISALCLTLMSCTKDKTDYEKEIETVVPEHQEFKEAVTIAQSGFRISIDALNGTFYTGYNELRLRIAKENTPEKVQPSAIGFMPIYTASTGAQSSCPHRPTMPYSASEGYATGYAVFTEESGGKGQWQVHIRFSVDDKIYSIKQAVSVQEQPNKNLNMTAFVGKDNGHYIIALIAPQKPKVGTNNLVAAIYKEEPTASSSINTDFPDLPLFAYSEAKGYTLQLDPRMPEPSMGNHSSPNNEDLKQQEDGLYHGVVNYTMTGNWTLNFIMLNKEGRILKGTPVSHDFTPGQMGAKSELFIDTLF